MDGARRGRQDVLFRKDLVERRQVVDVVVTLALRFAVVTPAMRLMGLGVQTVERQLGFDPIVVKRVVSR